MSTRITEASISLTLQRSHAIVNDLAAWVVDFCRMVTDDEGVASRLNLAAHELLENVAKYGVGSSVRIELKVYRNEGAPRLCLTTTNLASPERMARAVHILEGLRDTRDPIAYYDNLVLESAPKSGVSGLGLARICAEGELALDFEVKGDQLSMSVLAKI